MPGLDFAEPIRTNPDCPAPSLYGMDATLPAVKVGACTDSGDNWAGAVEVGVCTEIGDSWAGAVEV